MKGIMLLLIAATLVYLLSSAGISQHVITIDFERFPAGIVLDFQFADSGVIFSGAQVFESFAISGSNIVVNFFPGGPARHDELIVMTFVDPKSGVPASVSFIEVIDDEESGIGTLKAFDVRGDMIESTSASHAGEKLRIEYPGIVMAIFEDEDGDEFTGFDDLSFSSPMPLELESLDQVKQDLEEDIRPIVPEIEPPPYGVRFFDVIAPTLTYSGADIVVRVVTLGEPTRRPVSEVLVKLVSLDDSSIVAEDSTDGNGEVRFRAPKVSHPAVFLIDAMKESFACYWPEEDWRTRFQGTGFYPVISIAVVPASEPSSVGSTACLDSYPTILKIQTIASSNPKPSFEIDVAFGWTAWFRKPSFSPILKEAKGDYDTDEDWWVGDGAIFSHLKEKGKKDVWIFFGYSVDTDKKKSTAEGLTGWRAGALLWGYTDITMKDMCNKMTADCDAPGIVFLGGCSTASLLKEFVNCGVKIAVGFTNTLPSTTIGGVLGKFWSEFLNGKTLDQAMKKANDYLAGLKQSTRLKWEAKSWLQNPGNKTLKEIREAKP